MSNGTDNPRPTRQSRPRVRALCCNCGRVRTTTTNGQLAAEDWIDFSGSPRCMVERRCATCRTRTRHAYLRDGDGEYADFCERQQRKLPLNLTAEEREWVEAAAWDAVDAAVEWLNDCGVRVEWREDWPFTDDHALLVQDLTNGRYALALNPEDDPTLIAEVVDHLVIALATDKLNPYAWQVRVGSPENDYTPHRLQVLRHALLR